MPNKLLEISLIECIFNFHITISVTLREDSKKIKK